MSYTNGLDKPSNYFVTKLYTGNGSDNHTITGVGFQPDMIWIKERSSTSSHYLTSVGLGIGTRLEPNETSAEATEGISAVTSDGFTIGTSTNQVNENGQTYVSWNWKAGTSFTNDASSTGIGTIDSTGSVSDTAGFSIVSYTGTGSNGTIKHGLSTVPKIMIVKERDNANNWFVYHYSLGATKQLILQETDAEASFTATWNDTEPTSSVFSVGTSNGTNRSGGGLIAYCFAEKKGYSKFGSYTGNGNADGTFVYTGFKPAFLMVKRSSATEDWEILDNKRLGYNGANKQVRPNTNAAENDYAPTDFVSNGFKFRSANASINGSGTYIFMAFAENPFVTSTGVPATAR